ncbi:serine/threonine protein phosphatase 2A 55 kDa regulatory subunit B beta isoform isoform X1 [Senna tora]|uniref:Serine/threonine protein phosphatase 2A 55 kDa regulatory subunit B beta isoform isoform X1 n=1 Tax=Senna tora TaxID=362788 RepID=A0A834WTY7_9FABA|nr:serine/threonine protein phosphatase 2A 55 kDa regulatory subunit B beta isoform isoform X1 [Senna tora]
MPAQHGGSRRDLERMDYSMSRHPEFRYKTEFRSHEPEFDYLKSLEIEEKINKIRWCQTANGALFLLSTNDKTTKLDDTTLHLLKARLPLAEAEVNGERAKGCEMKSHSMDKCPLETLSLGLNELI